MNSAPLYLRFAKPADLEYLMPVFWIGFNLLMLPATLATQRYGGLAVMGAGGVAGALAAYFAAWGCVLMSAVAAALVIGHTGREGKVTGTLFSLLALATFARMAVVAAQLNKDPGFAALLGWMPVALWALAGALLLLLVPMQRRAAA